MAGLLSTTTVLNIHAGGADIDGFSEASSVARNALHGVEIPVWNPIRLGTVWTGAGHTEAEQVVHSNALALEIARTQMESAGAALAGARNVFVMCEKNLYHVIEYATSKGCRVNDDGSVVWDDNNVNKPEPVTGHDVRVQVNIEFSVTNVLRLATAADRSVKAALELVRRSCTPGWTPWPPTGRPTLRPRRSGAPRQPRPRSSP